MSDIRTDAAGLSPEDKRALLAQMLQKKLGATKTVHPLSRGQQSMWFMYQLAPDSAAYNVAFTARIRSEVDAPALQRAFQALTDRHACLRTTFALQDGQPVQEIYGYREVAFEPIDGMAWSADELRDQIAQAYAQPFDLENGPVFRAGLFTRAATDHVLLIAAHHIVMDGWSVWVLLDEFRALYAAERSGTVASLPVLSAQYTDFVDWQTAMLAGPEGERNWEYWQTQLSGELPVLNLPTDRPRPPVQTYDGATHDFALSEDLGRKIKALAKAHQTTPYTVLLSAFHVLLHRYTGQDDIWIGSPTAGRSRAEFAGIVGDFINMNVMRTDLSRNPTFAALLSQMRQTVLDALDHQDYPFLLLVEKLVKHHDPSRSPLYQVAFDLQRLHRFGELADLFVPGRAAGRVDVGGLIFEPYPMPQQEGQFDVTLQMAEVGDTLLGSFKYNVDLFDADTIARMQGHFRTLLEGIAADPDRRLSNLPLLTDAERYQLIVAWNNTQSDYPRDRCVHQLFEAQAARTPDATAAIFESGALTYRELNQRSNQLAHYLRRLGVGPETLVGLSVERSPDMLVGLLGILKAGGAYVPLDPAFPTDRLAFMLEDSGARVLLTQRSLLDASGFLPQPSSLTAVCLDTDWPAIARESADNFDGGATTDNLAYVLHTSGSTGKPKGVQIPHRALTNFLVSMQREPGLTERDTLLAVTTLSFDIAGLELYLPLITGARVVIASREAAADGPRLMELLQQFGVTVLQATPATWRMLIDSGWAGRPGLKMLCGGEALPRDLANQMIARGGSLWNMYGPTETTIWSSVCEVQPGDAPLSIGRPITNTQFYVLDASRQPAPISVPGELFIGGDGVARGYLNRPELTAEKFLSNPFDARLGHVYKTGDLVRYRADGSMEFLGRIDHQVKVRGFRIELGEIEVVLAQHPAVRESVVIVREDIPGDKRLAAYMTVSQPPAPPTQEFRNYLKEKLPEYMVPSTFVILEVLPLTPNGKIDRRALPKPDTVRSDLDDGFAPPATPMETLIAAVWREALMVDRVSVYDNFFDLGGHSLASVQVTAILEQKTGVRINPALIRYQTLGQLAASYEEQTRHPQPAPAKPAGGIGQRVFKAIKRAVSVGNQ